MSSNKKITETARKYALQNAVHFNGTAHPKAVIGKVIAAFKDSAIQPQEIIPIVQKIVQEVNTFSIDQQRQELETLAPELLVKEKKERDFSLPPLSNAENGKVVTRFPPEPNGYLHIGHAKAAIIDYQYARLYEGIFILRFDDTNPEHADPEFYDAQKEDLHWLDIQWQKEYCTSNNLETHYKLAEQLLRQGDAYLCKCTPETIKKGRYFGKACSCRNGIGEEAIDRWHLLLHSGETNAGILRLKGNMSSVNTAMRDPTLFRIIESPHPLQGDKYRMWPTYDFAGAVEDSISGVTHPFRTKEYELRDEVYFHILSLLDLRCPHLMEFSRLSITGMPVSKRKIKPLIDSGQVDGYDDIRLPTLRGLQKRGILPEAIKNFVLSQGISKVESSVDFSLLEAENRKLLDPQVKRLFFVANPICLHVTDAPHKTVSLPYHPSNDLGKRTMQTGNTFFIDRTDAAQINKGEIFRLKGLYNIRLTEKGKNLSGEFAGEKIIPESSKIQWTPEDYISMDVSIPDLLFHKDSFNEKSLTRIKGYAEPAVKTVSHGEQVQFERFGFVRISKSDNKIQAFFTHK